MAEKIASTNRSSGLAILRGGSRRRRRWLIIAAVAIALVVVVAVAYRPVYHYISWNIKSPAAQKASITKQLDTYGLHNQSQQALTYLNGRLSATRNADTHYFLLQQKALLLSNMSNFDQALAVYQQMAKLKPDDYTVITGIAQMADQQGNNALALQYYQKAVAYLQAHPSPLQNYDESGLQARIKVLQGQHP